MTVELDGSELSELEFYRDKRCEELENILSSSSEFNSCIVRRFKQMDEFREFGDPFDIQNEKENHLVWLYEHEVDTLDPTELVVFAKAQGEREIVSSTLVKWRGLGFGISFVGASGIVTSLIFYFAFSYFAPNFPFWFSLSMLVMLTGVFIFVIERQAEMIRKRDIDIKFALEEESFRRALQKLSPLSEITSKISDSYRDRLQAIEERL